MKRIPVRTSSSSIRSSSSSNCSQPTPSGPPAVDNSQPKRLFYRSYMSPEYKTEERVIKNIIYNNIKPTDPENPIALTIYYNHRTNQCKESEQVCSKCSAKEHDDRNCQTPTLRCINCNGEHTAVSFKCPIKRKSQQQQNSPKPTPLTYVQAATPNTPMQTTPNTNTNAEKLLLAEITIKYSIQTSFGDIKKKQPETMNSLLEYMAAPQLIFHRTSNKPTNDILNNTFNETNRHTLQEPEPTTPNETSPPSPGDLVIDEDSASEESQPHNSPPPQSTPTTTSTTTTTNTTNNTTKKEQNKATPHNRTPTLSPSTRTTSRAHFLATKIETQHGQFLNATT
ncbi:mucin-2-like [Scylla paramamosain]|uniref:mucin-2-like n=1 Tax=Scylla paramamosain TaxID=85552 RepID=UPI0030836081